MHKTSVYLPDDLRRALAATAQARGESEAAVIRAAIANEVAAGTGRPRPGIIASRGGQGGSRTADGVDEALAATGFGT